MGRKGKAPATDPGGREDLAQRRAGGQLLEEDEAAAAAAAPPPKQGRGKKQKTRQAAAAPRAVRLPEGVPVEDVLTFRAAEILANADLEVVTAKSIRQQMEKDLGTDLEAHKGFVKGLVQPSFRLH